VINFPGISGAVTKENMTAPDFQGLDLNIARARIVLSLAM
jgi:hypothetical protein